MKVSRRIPKLYPTIVISDVRNDIKEYETNRSNAAAAANLLSVVFPWYFEENLEVGDMHESLPCPVQSYLKLKHIHIL